MITLTLQGVAVDWRTPQAGDATRGATSERTRSQAYVDKAGRHSLVIEVHHWQAPATDSFRSRGGDRKDEMGLDQQARTWPSPTARCHKGGGQAVTRADGKSRLDMLDWAAEAWTSPTAIGAFAHVDLLLPDRPTPSGMKPSETRRSLNPLFVEWLMGWPEGLSGFERSATAFAHWLLRMRGELSRLCSTHIETRQGSLL